MTTSASTPRLRITLYWYLAVLVATALSAPPSLHPGLAAVIDAGALLCVSLAVLGRIWCSVYIAGRKDADLVTEGPYSLCRHPLYSLSMLGGLGLGAATHSLVLSLATLALLLGLFSRAATAEERYLAGRHGAAFERYRLATPRFLPSRLRHALAESIAIQPRVLWKAFVDGSAFLLLYALVVAARHAAGSALLPTLFGLS